MDEQREAVADGAVKSEQQRKREYQLGDAQGIRCRHRQRHSVKAACYACGRVWENQLLDAPLQQKNREKEPQDEKARLECVCRFPATSDVSLLKPAVRAAFRLTSTDRKLHRSAYSVGNAVGQNYLEPIDRG